MSTEVKPIAGLWPVDSKIENLAIMRIATWCRLNGYDPVLFKPGELNFVSAVFTKSQQKVERLSYLPNLVVGGTGVDVKSELPPEMASLPPDYSIYPDCDYSLGFTSRGCDGDCPYCVVPEKEGHTRSVASIQDIWRPGTDMVVLLDNDFLGNPDFYERLMEIKKLGIKVNFSQGINIKKINDFSAQALASVKISNRTRTASQVHFAFDKIDYEPFIRSGVNTLVKAGIRPYRLMFYMLVGYDTTWEEDMARFQILRELGCVPYVMVYAPINEAEAERVAQKYSPWEMGRLRQFARWVNWRVYKKTDFDNYEWWIRFQKREANKCSTELF